jgi:UDP-glucose 4-epimerase
MGLAKTGLTGKRVLVSGGSGFLGAPLCRRLLGAGAEVHAVTRQERESGDVRWWQVNLEDLDATRRLLATVSPDVVFHLGGAVTGAPALEHVPPTFASLLATTVNLLQAVTECQCGRMIVVGSLEEPRGRIDQLVPLSPYGAAKCAASMYARMFHALYQTPVSVLRLFMTYGPGQPEHRLISYAIRSFLRGESPKLASGRRRLDLVYLDDAIDGFMRAAALPGLEGRCADLGSGQAVSVQRVVQTIAGLMRSSIQPIWNALADRPSERSTRIADVQSAKDGLGWAPATPLDVGLARTIDWCRSHSAAEGRVS